MRHLLVKLIETYQATLSPDHGWLKAKYPYGYCRYSPSCSEYGKQAILKKGVLAGSFLAIYRVARCNPWSAGGIDEVRVN